MLLVGRFDYCGPCTVILLHRQCPIVPTTKSPAKGNATGQLNIYT
jgi:hypothetical protein